ncbi:MAG TPA: zinc dependent phospholipase C family protein [bacterium]|nr:zinc dependent phospholipase C family protein [bacterium]
MPSLFTHLILAEDLLDALPVGAGRSMLQAHREAFYLGSLAPDLPYFDMFHRWKGLALGSVISPMGHAVESKVAAWLGWSLPAADGWAERLHSADTLGILRRWASWARPHHGPLFALVCGMLTHVAADEALHPKVNQDSGASPDSAEGLRRHRELEINLDYVLLRSRGVGLEGLKLEGLLELYLGRVGQNNEYLDASLKAAWVEASLAQDGSAPLTRGGLDGWSRGFSGAMRLLSHRLSPMEQQRQQFLRGGEEQWRTFFARERYLASHVPRAGRLGEAMLARVLDETSTVAGAH